MNRGEVQLTEYRRHVLDCTCPPRCIYAEDGCPSEPCTCPVICAYGPKPLSTYCISCRCAIPWKDTVYAVDESRSLLSVRYECRQCTLATSDLGQIAHVIGGVFESVATLCALPPHKLCDNLDPLFVKAVTFAMKVINSRVVSDLYVLFLQSTEMIDYINSPVLDWLVFTMKHSPNSVNGLAQVKPLLLTQTWVVPDAPIPTRFFHFISRFECPYMTRMPTTYLLRHAQDPVEVIDFYVHLPKLLPAESHPRARILSGFLADCAVELPCGLELLQRAASDCVWSGAMKELLYDINIRPRENVFFWVSVPPEVVQFLVTAFPDLLEQMRTSRGFVYKCARIYSTRPDTFRCLLDLVGSDPTVTLYEFLHTYSGQWRTWWRWARDHFTTLELNECIQRAVGFTSNPTYSIPFIVFIAEELGINYEWDFIDNNAVEMRSLHLEPHDMIGIAKVWKASHPHSSYPSFIERFWVRWFRPWNEQRVMLQVAQYLCGEQQLSYLFTRVQVQHYFQFRPECSDTELLELLDFFPGATLALLCQQHRITLNFDLLEQTRPLTYRRLFAERLPEVDYIHSYHFAKFATSEFAIQCLMRKAGGVYQARRRWPLHEVMRYSHYDALLYVPTTQLFLLFRLGLYSDQTIINEFLFGCTCYLSDLLLALLRNGSPIVDTLITEWRFQIRFWQYLAGSEYAVALMHSSDYRHRLKCIPQVLAQLDRQEARDVLKWTFREGQYRMTEEEYLLLIKEAIHPNVWPRSLMVTETRRKRKCVFQLRSGKKYKSQ